MSIRKIILFLEVLIGIVAVIFAFFYGAIYSESIQKNIPFFFGRDTGSFVDENKMMETEIGTERSGNINDEIDEFFKDEIETVDEDLNALPSESEETTISEEEMPPVIVPISEGELTTPTGTAVSSEVEAVQEDAQAIQEKMNGSELESVKKEGVEMMQVPETPTETITPPAQPILIPEMQLKQEDVGEIQQIQESDSAIPSDAEEVQIEIGDEPVKIEGLKGIESEEIDLEDLEEIQQQQEIDVDSDLIDL